MTLHEKKTCAFAKRTILLLPAIFPLAACTRAPSVDVLGSFFPAWLLCLTIAVVVTVFAQLLLSHFRLRVAYPVLFYASLATFLTFLLWLIFFH